MRFFCSNNNFKNQYDNIEGDNSQSFSEYLKKVDQIDKTIEEKDKPPVPINEVKMAEEQSLE